ncbi:efflux transporter, outer membrane factor lipoprotein, NodT family [delta proteobacterium NaphS2]|nr:efflux transporter, outer membrane factor lipoprotein, NodT family [delta proteobacterium NaphS2]
MPGRATCSEDVTNWWTVFNDPVLNSLVEKALNQNLTLQVAGLRIFEARAELGFTTGLLYPQQQRLQAGASRVKSSKNAANTMLLDTDYVDYDVGFDAAWELDFWGRYRRAVEAADASLHASIADYDNAMVTLVAEVARTYVLIRTFEKRIALARENTGIQQRSLEIAQRRFKGGIVTELDVQQATALLKNTQALVPRFTKNLQEAKHALSVLLGLPPGELPESLVDSRKVPMVLPQVVVGVPAELLRRRPDIRRAEMMAAAQCDLIGVAKADLYPHFILIGSIGLRTSTSLFTKAGGIDGSNFSDLFSSDSFQLFAGPSIRWDIFNYGRLKNKVRVQDARFQQLIVQYQNTVLNAAREVEDAIVGFLRSQDENAFLKSGVQASKRAVDISLLQYREGLVDYQRVLSAQSFLTQQQDQQTSTSSLVALNLISLYKALGGGWDIRQEKGFVSNKIKKEMRQRTDWGDLLD